MTKARISIFLRIISLVLVLAMISPVTATATTNDLVHPYASKYLTAYSGYVYVTGTGQVQVWYEVMGTGIMDEIGVLSVLLYESTDNKTWTWVKTFSHENYSSMLVEDDYYHSSCVSYQGSTSKYYKAYVCFWAGKSGSGDTRYMWVYEV